jgi:hypothetical protein
MGLIFGVLPTAQPYRQRVVSGPLADQSADQLAAEVVP